MAEGAGVNGEGGALAARPALGDLAAGIALEECGDRALVTVIVPAGDGGRTRAALEAAFATALPDIGRSARAARGERLLGLQRDRLYVMFGTDGHEDPVRTLAGRLAGTGGGAGGDADADADGGGGGGGGGVRAGASGAMPLRLNDQSDSWVMLRVSGRHVRGALELVCPARPSPRRVPRRRRRARTVMEHLSAIVLREGEDDFLLLSPRSSAASFLHEIETSIRHVRGRR